MIEIPTVKIEFGLPTVDDLDTIGHLMDYDTLAGVVRLCTFQSAARYWKENGKGANGNG